MLIFLHYLRIYLCIAYLLLTATFFCSFFPPLLGMGGGGESQKTLPFQLCNKDAKRTHKKKLAASQFSSTWESWPISCSCELCRREWPVAQLGSKLQTAEGLQLQKAVSVITELQLHDRPELSSPAPNFSACHRVLPAGGEGILGIVVQLQKEHWFSV